MERMSFGSGGNIVVTRGIVARQAMLCAKRWGIGLADGWNVNLGGLDEGNARLPFQETWKHMKNPCLEAKKLELSTRRNLANE